MNWEATLAYLHYSAIFALCGAVMVEYVFLRQPDVRPYIAMLARTDIVYGITAIAVLVTGLCRVFWFGKGVDFYLATWLFHAKIFLAVLTALVSLVPTLRILRWKKDAAVGALVQPPANQKSTRLLVLLEMHLIFLMPLCAVFMARGYGQ